MGGGFFMKSSIVKLIGKRIKEERKKEQMTQKQFAKKMDVTASFIFLWEQGKNSLSSSYLLLLPEYLPRFSLEEIPDQIKCFRQIP